MRNTRLGSVKSKQKLHIYRQLLSRMLITSYFMTLWFFDGPASSENQTGARVLLNPDCVSNIYTGFPLLCSLLIYRDQKNTNLGKKPPGAVGL